MKDDEDKFTQMAFNVIVGLPVLGLVKLGQMAWRNKGNLKNIPNYLELTPAKIKDEINLKNGVYFGYQTLHRWGKKYRIPITRDINEDGHVLVIGGAGSGKSSCIAIPTLKRYWDRQFLAIDIKGELAEKSGRNALIFNPTDATAYGYNPFYFVKKSKNPKADIRTIALTLVPTSSTTKEPFWNLQAQSILTGHLLYSYKHGLPFFQALKTVLTTPIETIIEMGIHDEDCHQYFSDNVNQKKETLGSIMGELKNHILPYLTDPDIEQALTTSTIITPEHLEEGYNIFLQIPEYKLQLWNSLLALIVQQFLDHFQRRDEKTATPILLLLDEFPALGKIDGVIHGLATLRSKKICICILIQSLAQLDATYGAEQRKIIADNCQYKAILRATDADTQRYFSSLIGTHKVPHKSISKKNTGIVEFIFAEPLDPGSESVSLVEEPILKPEQLAYLDKELILLTPQALEMVAKLPYYVQDTLETPPKLDEPKPREIQNEDTSRTGSGGEAKKQSGTLQELVNFHGLVNPRSLSKLNQEIKESKTFEGLVTLRGFKKSNKDTPLPRDPDPPQQERQAYQQEQPTAPTPPTKPKETFNIDDYTDQLEQQWEQEQEKQQQQPTAPTPPPEPLAPEKKYKPFDIDYYIDQLEQERKPQPEPDPSTPTAAATPLKKSDTPPPPNPEPAPPVDSQPRDALGDLLDNLNVARHQSDYDPDQDPYDPLPRKRKR